MALLACPECGKQVSPRAPACPGCGEPMGPSASEAASGQPAATPEAASVPADEPMPAEGLPPASVGRDFVGSRNLGRSPREIREREPGARLLDTRKAEGEARFAGQPAPPTGPDLQGWLAVAAGGLLVGGVWLPWFLRAGGMFKSAIRGIDSTDGVAALILGILTALVGLARLTSTKGAEATRRLPALLGLAVGGILAYELNFGANVIAVARSLGSDEAGFFGSGVYVTLAGAALAIVAGILPVGQKDQR